MGKFTSPACCCVAGGGFKHAIAMVRWLGGEHPYGYLTPAENSVAEPCADVDRNWWDSDPCPGSSCTSYIPYSPDPPDHKYLGLTVEIAWDHEETRFDPGVFDTRWVFRYRRSRDTHTDRYSGEGTEEDLITWDETYTDALVPANNYEIHLTGQDALDKFNDPATAQAPFDVTIDAQCGHIQPETPLAGADGDWVITSTEVADDSILVTAEIDEVTDTGSEHFVKTASFSVHTILWDKFTSIELYTLAKELLAQWDLGDHDEYPWRTTCSGEAYHLGPVVTFDYGGDFFGVPGAVIGGPYPGESWSTGDHCLTGYSHEGMSGGSAWFNNVLSTDWGYGHDWGEYFQNWNGDCLILGKWAEKKVTIPAHNYARPCGPTDAAALMEDDLTPCWGDPDGLDPDAVPDPCAGACNSTTPTGDYTTLTQERAYRLRNEAARMNGMAALCPGGSPCSDAHAYTVVPEWVNTCEQQNAATGTVLLVSPNEESFIEATDEFAFPDTIPSDDKYGYVWICHVRQVMPDPLMVCFGLYEGNPDAVLLEEARCEQPVGCPTLPDGSFFYCTDSDDLNCGFQDTFGILCPQLTDLA